MASPLQRACGVVISHLNGPAREVELCPREGELIEGMIRRRIKCLEQAEVFDSWMNVARLANVVKSRCLNRSGCCQGYALAFLFYVMKKGVETAPFTLMQTFMEERAKIPIVALHNWENLTLAGIADVVAREAIGTLNWSRKQCYVLDDSIITEGYDVAWPPFFIKSFSPNYLTPLVEVLKEMPPNLQFDPLPEMCLRKNDLQAREGYFFFSREAVYRRLKQISEEYNGKHLIVHFDFFSQEKRLSLSHAMYLFCSLEKERFLFFDSNSTLEIMDQIDPFLFTMTEFLQREYYNSQEACFITICPFLIVQES